MGLGEGGLPDIAWMVQTTNVAQQSIEPRSPLLDTSLCLDALLERFHESS